MNKFLVFALFSFVFFACQKDSSFPQILENEPIVENSDIQADLQDYFDRFEAAAQARGIDLQLADLNLTGRIEEIDENNVAGQCSYGSNHPSEIVIDASFWSWASENLKEMVVFHELGHCVLHRGHEEGQFQNGACRSIMRSGTESCLDNYHSQTREYYLDELFSEADL